MNRLIISILILIFGCNDPEAPGCLRQAGDLTEIQYDFDTYQTIEITGDIDVVLTENGNHSGVLRIPENFVNDINILQHDNILVIEETIPCQVIRTSATPTLTLSFENLRLIRQFGHGIISSEGTLTSDTLEIEASDSASDFKLDLATGNTIIASNDVANFHLSGTTDRLTVGFFAGNGRCECDNLQTREAVLFHRGTNDMRVHATEILSGRILSTGNIVYVNSVPKIIDVRNENRGQLINGID